MRGNIKNAAALPQGGHLLSLVLSVLALGAVCVVDFSLRWVQWCNVSEHPFSEAAANTLILLVSAFFTALVSASMMRPQHLWRVPLAYGVFFSALPTLLFFQPYLTANALVVLSMYNVMRIQDNPATEKVNVFFASFFVVLSGWFVPASVAFLLPVYAGVLLFAPSDVRSWIIPLVGAATSYMVLLTCEVVFEGGDTFFPELSRRVFAMPYTEKVFTTEGFYFYAVALAVALFWAYLRYWRFAAGEIVARKKRFMAISAMMVSAAGIVAVLPVYKYLAVFFALPFAVITTRFFAIVPSRRSRAVMAWYLATVAVLGLVFFR